MKKDKIAACTSNREKEEYKTDQFMEPKNHPPHHRSQRLSPSSTAPIISTHHSSINCGITLLIVTSRGEGSEPSLNSLRVRQETE
jgi:hypothetical protein